MNLKKKHLKKKNKWKLRKIPETNAILKFNVYNYISWEKLGNFEDKNTTNTLTKKQHPFKNQF